MDDAVQIVNVLMCRARRRHQPRVAAAGHTAGAPTRLAADAPHEAASSWHWRA